MLWLPAIRMQGSGPGLMCRPCAHVLVEMSNSHGAGQCQGGMMAADQLTPTSQHSSWHGSVPADNHTHDGCVQAKRGIQSCNAPLNVICSAA